MRPRGLRWYTGLVMAVVLVVLVVYLVGVAR
jgi:hypothetical protein